MEETTSMVTDQEVIGKRRFEYLDHPADVQIHAWGINLEEAFEACLTAMFGYMTDLGQVEEKYDYYWRAKGENMQNLLFMFLDEALNSFQAEPFFVARKVEVIKLDKENFEIKFRGVGESFDREKHVTEADIKSPTYSNMQIVENEGKCDIFVIVDI